MMMRRLLPVPAFALVAAPRTSHCDDDEPPPTLRQWLAQARFGLAISQGWGCEAQSLGALLALRDALGSDSALRAALAGASGASSGAKIAALAALPHVPLDRAAEGLLRVRPVDILCDKSDLVPPWRGGALAGDAVVRAMRALWGARARADDCAAPWAASAFDVRACRSVVVARGDLAAACQASGAFPLVFAPRRVAAADLDDDEGRPLLSAADGDARDSGTAPPRDPEAPTRLLTDLAALTDPAGVRALRLAPAPSSAAPAPARVLQIAGADWNLRRWLVTPPSRLPRRVIVAGGDAGAEVVSLVLEGQCRVLPWPPGMGARARIALDGARAGVIARLDEPLERGAEKGHWVCVVRPVDSADAASARRRGRLLAGAIWALAVGASALVHACRRR